VHECEADLVTSFFDLLYSLKLSRGGEHRFFEPLPKRRRSKSIMRFYKIYHFLLWSPLPLALHFLGRTFGEIRLFREWFSVWMATLGNILTFDNLRKRCVIVVD
jgi:hypothetical protein